MTRAILSLLFNQQPTNMALAHPALNTTGRRRGKVKFKSAAEAQRARELDREWHNLQQRWSAPAPDTQSKKSKAMSAPTLSYQLSAPPGRSTAHIPSVNTGHTGAVSSKQIPQYTGTKVLGIGTMHKSNVVPIFSDEEAVSIATMRRG
jgi:hypothetical protein